ncbi:hypothetical protein BD413DRAFT_493405 [Trametes elegans]|nr:hypothetical protein BD413DRAFT_493405 [Trametes elegans]
MLMSRPLLLGLLLVLCIHRDRTSSPSLRQDPDTLPRIVLEGLEEAQDMPSLQNLDSSSDSIDFRWERFDRGHTLVEPSSSPRDGANGSEETFWSQSAQVFPGLIEVGQRRTPQTSPQALFEHRPTSRPPGPAFHHPDTAAAGAGTPTPRPQDTAEGERSLFGPPEEGDGGPFAWIVPPRDRPAPSTPRRTSTTPVVEPQPSSTRAGAPAGGQSQKDADTASSAKLGEAQDEDGAPVHPCAPSFAPAPGIYLSPLRGEDGAADEDGASAHSTPVAVVRSPRGEASRQSRVALHNERTEVQDVTTQSPREMPPGGDVNAGVTADEIEDADELSGESSQESRDTIESWSS